jgi:hypothetical protein
VRHHGAFISLRKAVSNRLGKHLALLSSLTALKMSQGGRALLALRFEANVVLVQPQSPCRMYHFKEDM